MVLFSIGLTLVVIIIRRMLRACLFVTLLICSHRALAGEPEDLENMGYSGRYGNTGPGRLFNYLDVADGDIDVYFLSDIKTKLGAGGVSLSVV